MWLGAIFQLVRKISWGIVKLVRPPAGGVWLGAGAEDSRFRGNNVIASNTVRVFFFFITLKPRVE